MVIVEALWKRRRAAYPHATGNGARAAMYSGKRVVKLVVKARPLARQ